MGMESLPGSHISANVEDVAKENVIKSEQGRESIPGLAEKVEDLYSATFKLSALATRVNQLHEQGKGYSGEEFNSFKKDILTFQQDFRELLTKGTSPDSLELFGIPRYYEAMQELREAKNYKQAKGAVKELAYLLPTMEATFAWAVKPLRALKTPAASPKKK